MNLYKFCKETKNFFPAHPQGYATGEDIYNDTYEITSGGIAPLDFIAENQYFRIVGSLFNDGIYKNTPEELSKLTDEIFLGAIWAMAVPPDVLDLIEDISEWEAKYSAAINSPFTSESFDGYSYSKSNATSGQANISWQSQFKNAVNAYRRLSII